MKLNKLALAVGASLLLGGTAYAEPELSVGGIIEIEATSGEDSSDIAVATAELGFLAEVNDKVIGELVLLHEAGESDPVTVDIATVTLTITENINIIAGQSYAPFGLFASNMISDPLTLELAETGATLLQAELLSGPIVTSLYTFNGVNASDEEIDNWGINLGYVSDNITVIAGYISNIGDSDGIGAETIDSEVPGISLSAELRLGAFGLIAEHISASDDFQPGDGNADYIFVDEAQPSASNIELAYTTGAMRYAIGSQQSNEAEVLGLPESRLIAAISHEFMPNTLLSLEYARDEDYAGEESDMVTAQIAVEF